MVRVQVPQAPDGAATSQPVGADPMIIDEEAVKALLRCTDPGVRPIYALTPPLVLINKRLEAYITTSRAESGEGKVCEGA